VTDADVADGAVPHLAFRAARRRWQVVVAGALVGLLAAAAVGTVLPHKFRATAKVVVNPVPSDSPDARSRATGSVSMETEAQIARGGNVRELAATKYLPRTVSPTVLGSGLTVSVVPNSSVLRFDFDAKKSAVAVAAAQAYAAAYLDNRAATAQTFVSNVIGQLQSQIDTTQKQITRTKAARDAAAPRSGERQRQQVALNALNDKLLTAENDLATQQNAQIQPGTEITKPSASKRTGVSLPALLGLGLLLGLLLGLGAATLRERTDPRLREAGDIQDDLGVPLLAILPPHDPDSVIDPDSAAADAYRQLRNEIFLGPNPPVVLAISRVDPDTGTGDVTANLAVLLSRSGRRVCVIDTDTGPRRLESLLEGMDRVGLVHAGAGDGYEPGIAVVTQRHGVGQAKLGDVLASPLFARMVDATRLEAEVVLIDAPPALSSAGQAVLSTADAALLVVTRRRTRRQDVLVAEERIKRVGSRLVGTAVRESDPVRDTTAPSSTPDQQPAALPAGDQTALPTATGGIPSNVRVSAGATYRPDPPTTHVTAEPFPSEPVVQEPHDPFVRVSPTPQSAAYDEGGWGTPEGPDGIEGVLETADVAVGWPIDSHDADSTDANGASSGLGWPESHRAIP
jgi:Mrp family chromosome partitioning ATPase/uncharacterized protein involved in exopolysaccharide biosynthesis